MKTLGIAIVCGLFGGFIGLMAGTGETRYYKKSQQSFAFPFFAIGGAAIGFIGGIMIGLKIEEEEKEEKERKRLYEEQLEIERIKREEDQALELKLGLNNITTIEIKDGRKWCYQSSWTNPETGNLNKIETRYSKEIDSVITTFNNETIYDHKSNSGSKVNIDKFHNFIIYQVIHNIKINKLTMI